MKSMLYFLALVVSELTFINQYYAGVDITKRMDDSVHRIFMDPTARHLIVCMKSQESFYLARNSKKPKPLAKMKVLYA